MTVSGKPSLVVGGPEPPYNTFTSFCADNRLRSAVRTSYIDDVTFDVRRSGLQPARRPGTRHQSRPSLPTCEIRHVHFTASVATLKTFFSFYQRTAHSILVGGIAIMRYINVLLTLTLTLIRRESSTPDDVIVILTASYQSTAAFSLLTSSLIMTL